MNNSTPENMPFVEVPNDQVASVGREMRKTVDFLYVHIQQVSCVSPLLMLGAFGIELFLKSLNSKCVYHQDEVMEALGVFRVTATPLKKVHPLVTLFDEIQPPYRTELEDAYARQPVVRDKKTLRDALSVYDSLFIKARYPFEAGNGGGGQSITDLVKLLGVIADHVGSLAKRVHFSQN